VLLLLLVLIFLSPHSFVVDPLCTKLSSKDPEVAAAGRSQAVAAALAASKSGIAKELQASLLDMLRAGFKGVMDRAINLTVRYVHVGAHFCCAPCCMLSNGTAAGVVSAVAASKLHTPNHACAHVYNCMSERLHAALMCPPLSLACSLLRSAVSGLGILISQNT
jgi:hypothetical protein